jgi:hypothetical protein
MSISSLDNMITKEGLDMRKYVLLSMAYFQALHASICIHGRVFEGVRFSPIGF